MATTEKFTDTAALRVRYNFEAGYNVSDLELDSFTEGVTRHYCKVSKLSGVNKFGRILMDDFKYFQLQADGSLIEVSNPYEL